MTKLKADLVRLVVALRANPVRVIGFVTIAAQQLAVLVPGLHVHLAYRVAISVLTFLATELARGKVTPAQRLADVTAELEQLRAILGPGAVVGDGATKYQDLPRTDPQTNEQRVGFGGDT